MEVLEMGFLKANLLDRKTVLVEAREGVEIDHEKSTYANQLIQDKMPGDYGMIIVRNRDYSIVPIDVYKVLNSIDTLKALAIVTPAGRNFLPIQTEKKMYDGQLESFLTVEEAQKWIEEVVE